MKTLIFYIVQAIISVISVSIAVAIMLFLYMYFHIGLGWSFLIGMILVIVCAFPLYMKIGNYFEDDKK